MTDQAVERPPDCPDHIDWDSLSRTAQRGLRGRYDQLGRTGLNDDEVMFVARIKSAPRSARRSAPAGSAAGRGNHTRVAS